MESSKSEDVIEEPSRKKLRRSAEEPCPQNDSKGSDNDYANTITDGRSSNSSSGSNSGSGDEDDRARRGAHAAYKDDRTTEIVTSSNEGDSESSLQAPRRHRYHHHHHQRDQSSDPDDSEKNEERPPTPVKRRADGKKHVEKGSLNLEDLIEAKNRVISKNKNKDFKTEEEIKEERRAANRLSAFQSRQRRKIIIDDLTKTVARLSKDNAEHRDTISLLKTQLKTVTIENEFLRSQLYANKNTAVAQHPEVASQNATSSTGIMNGALPAIPPSLQQNRNTPTIPGSQVSLAAFPGLAGNHQQPQPQPQLPSNGNSNTDLLQQLTLLAKLQQELGQASAPAPVTSHQHVQGLPHEQQLLFAQGLLASTQQTQATAPHNHSQPLPPPPPPQQQQQQQQPSAAQNTAQSLAQLLQDLINQNKRS